MQLKRIIIAFFLLVTIFQLKAQENNTKSLYHLAEISKNWFEGFQKNLRDNEFSYGSFRTDVSKSLITRCTDGHMAIEWETATVPGNFNQAKAGFLWIAAMDLTQENCVFDVFVNDTKRFEITTSTQKNWEQKTDDGGILSFTNVETDTNGDAHGYMSLIAPANWLVKGKGQKIKIVGHAEGSNTWIIVYQATDALSWMHHSLSNNIQLELVMQKTGKEWVTSVKAPAIFAGDQLTITSGKKSKKVNLEAGDGNSIARFTLPYSAENKTFILRDSIGPIIQVKALGSQFSSSFLAGKSIVQNQGKTVDGNYHLTARRNYAPQAVNSILQLSNSVLDKGKILLMNSSHQDIAWMDSPEKCVLERDTMLIKPLLDWVQKHDDYRFDIEDVLMIKEYISRHPEQKELVKKLLAEGRLSCGATFIQPYEEMYSGEALARQFYFGAKWLKDNMGYQANVYWNEDVPGRTLQMMQIMRKAGVNYLMMSRQEKGMYKWYSPDGSFVTAYSPGHYSLAYTPLKKNFFDAAQFVATSSLDWEKYYSPASKSPVMPLLSDWDMSPGVDHSVLMHEWKNINGVENKKGNISPLQLPPINYSTAPEFFKSLVAYNPNLTIIHGERPAVWLYIHGPSHQKAIKASREGDILLTQAEKFATANALVKGSFTGYPEKELNKAWEAKIYPDHGWGGKHGDITDALFRRKYDFAKAEAQKILYANLAELASAINTDNQKGKPLVVFNSLNWTRTDPVEMELNLDESAAFDVQLKDEKDTTIETQLADVVSYPDGSIKKARLCFMAENVPSIGYKTLYLQTLKSKKSSTPAKFQNIFENQFYKVEFANGGLKSIYDKELNKELVNPGKFKAGEVFTMQSEGNGAGEFADIQQPDMQGFDKTGNYDTKWEVEESGPLCTVFKFRQKIRNAVVEERVRIYNREKRIDFDVALLNWEGVLYREYRMALPLNSTGGQVAYEVPYGVSVVGKDEMEGAAGERYTTPCKDFHPRGIENWISAGNSDFGVTMSSSVVAADWIDPTDNPVDYTILQPILLASRKSCHWEGNEYLQTGNHHFRFSITSHKPGWENGFHFGRQANEKLLAVWAGEKYASARLPESLSFFGVDQNNVLVSTIKKAEDSNDYVVRMVDMEGKDKTVVFQSFEKINQAVHTNLIEDDLKKLNVTDGKLEFPLGHYAIETVKVK